jgi:hypothetical protein
MRTRASRIRLVAVVAAGTLLGTGGLAAAGSLPDPAQDIVADALARVGVALPGGSDEPVEAASTGAAISQLATTTEATGVDKGAVISTEASGGMSQAGQHGLGNEAAGAGTDLADEKSGGASSAGTGTGEEAGSTGTDTAEDAAETGLGTAGDASGGRSDISD